MKAAQMLFTHTVIPWMEEYLETMYHHQDTVCDSKINCRRSPWKSCCWSRRPCRPQQIRRPVRASRTYPLSMTTLQTPPPRSPLRAPPRQTPVTIVVLRLVLGKKYLLVCAVDVCIRSTQCASPRSSLVFAACVLSGRAPSTFAQVALAS